MKQLRHILNAIVWVMIGSYLIISILLHIPAIQKYTGECVAKALQEKFGTKTTIGNINLGFLNRIIIDDFCMLDQENKQMLKAARLSASLDIQELTRGKVSLSSAQIFGIKATIYRKDAQSKLNCQFVIDSLSTGSKSESSLDLCINSFIIRNGNVRYDNLSTPHTPQKLNTSHISLSNISANISVRRITDRMVDATIKKLAFNESSGLSLKRLSMHVYADDRKVCVRDLKIEMPHSALSSDSISASYAYGKDEVDYNSIKAAGTIKARNISMADFAFLTGRQNGFNTELGLYTSFECANGKVNISKFHLFSKDNDMHVSAEAFAKPFTQDRQWGARINDLYIGKHSMEILHSTLKSLKVKLPTELSCLKTVSAKATGYGKGNDISANAYIETNIGSLHGRMEKKGNRLNALIDSKGIDLKEITGNGKLGTTALTINAACHTQGNRILDATLHGTAANLQYNKYTFTNIYINGEYKGNSARGTLGINDPNCKAEARACVSNIGGIPMTDISASISRLNPQRINVSDKWGDAVFSARLSAHATGKSLNTLHGNLSVRDFLFASPSETYGIEKLDAKMTPREISLSADFGNININGKYDLATLPKSVLAILKSKLPTMPGLEKNLHAMGNNFSLSANITDTRWLNTLLGIPFKADSPIRLSAKIDDTDKSIYAKAILPEFSYNGDRYRSAVVDINTKNDTLYTRASIMKLLDGGNDIMLNMSADAAGNKLNTALSFNYNTPTRIKGNVMTQCQFYKDSNGNSTLDMTLMPSAMAINDTVWNISQANIIYNKQKIQVEHFAVERGMQHIRIDGTATRSPQDSIQVDLQDVDVDYILNLVDFHSVTFSGKASGKAYLKSVLNNPDAYARINVKDFKFQDGHMGELYADVAWNKKEKQIDIDAHADEKSNARTLIKGYVSPDRNYIDLGITAENTNIEFLQSFCGSFMDNINARCNGFAEVYGDLSFVNLRGLLVADGSLRIKPLNTTYNLRNDTIRMVPDEIIFNGDTVTDRNGNVATVTGALHHKNLTRLTYDLDIRTSNFLCFDTSDYGDNTFYGTVYGTGKCSITGRPHNILFDIDLTPHNGSFIEYNATSPDAITSRDFITWVNSDKAENGETAAKDSLHAKANTEKNINDASDMRINVNINTSPDFTLRVLMDKVSGDKISLNGSGAIKASYFNKGSFDMFGTYLIDHGSYSLTIQNIIKKDFLFQQGSSIVFGGNPFNAALNLKAVYPVNGVSLADLHIGNSFSSNNVRVDCIMNIGGTPESIRVDFDFDMPTVNNDAKQMVRSLINSEEEMNQQVVYLLAIGRFYTANKNNSSQENAQQSQTSLAMQSLLSGTISQQVNNILGTLINNSNWNFGTNISTGTEGFNNAEYEGLLSGRLFSNRLLINGQFGYRDNPNTTSSFIGDFDVKYLLTPNGNVAIKVYNQTNDRYFTKSSLNTQGLGIILKRDFINWRDLFKSGRNKRKIAGK